jgi:hypothetical protein
VFWRPIPRRETQRILFAAKRFDRINRPFGSRTGALGHVALEVLELLANLVSYRTGQLDPSIDTIMRLCHRSRDAVVRALAALRQHGFLDWLRRYVPAEGAGARGPQVQQTSNAYRLFLPARAAALVGRWLAPPAPEDDSHRRERVAADQVAQIAALPLWEQPAALLGDTPLAQALGRMGRGVVERSERESARQTESRSDIYPRGQDAECVYRRT